MTSYDTILVQANNVSQIPAFMPISGNLNGPVTATEANILTTVRVAGTFKNFLIRMTVNTSAGARLINFRKNSANANLVISVTASTTGLFEDTTHTDAAVAGDIFDVAMAGNAGTVTPTLVSLTFLATTDTATILTTNDEKSNSTTGKYYLGLCGPTTNVNTTESKAAVRQRVACTYKNLYLYIRTNGDVRAHTLKSRKNSAAGAMSISIPTSTTGVFEDVTNSDTIAIGDDYDMEFDNTSALGGTTLNVLAVTMVNTAVTFILTGDDANGDEGTIAAALTRYIPISGSPIHQATESDVQLKIRNSSMVLKELTVNIGTNTVNGATTIRTRKNGANGAMSVSVGASTTGIFNDSTNRDGSLVSTDLINYQIVTGGSTGTLVVNSISSWGAGSTNNVRTISEGAVTASAATIVLKIIRAISNTAITVSQTLGLKVTRKISESSVSISNTLSLKVIRAISNTAITVTDSITKTRFYKRTLTESSSITTTLLRKVMPKITESAKTISDSLKLKAIRVITEPAKTISNTLSLKVIRVITEPAKTVTDSIKKKAFKTITEPAKTIVGTLSLKVIRPMSETVTASSSLSRIFKAIRTISNVTITVTDTTALKITRKINEPAKTISDSLVGHKTNTLSISEPAKTISASLALKIIRKINETGIIVSASSIAFKVIRRIINSSITVSDSITTLKVLRKISEPSITVGASIISRIKKAVRSISESSITISDSLLKSATYHRSPPTEIINNILDNIVIHKKNRIIISEPNITVGSSTLTRQMFYVRTINDTPISVIDTINRSHIISEQEHIFKLGLTFSKKMITDDVQFYYDKIKTETFI